ncbi:AraC family transcriptional regulator [Cohnella fermenti]|nr:AraC family transcriptional regulator [Cohnella fermenti]
MLFSISNRTCLEVKWANVHRGDERFYRTPHSNPHYNLIMVIDGPVYLEAAGEKLTLQAGEVLLLTPWQEHQGWRSSEPHSGFFWAQFAAEPGLGVIRDNAEPEDEIPLLQPAANDLRTSPGAPPPLLLPQRMRAQSRFEILVLFEKLIDEMDRPRGYYRFRAASLLWTMLERLADETLRQRNADTSLPASFLTYRRIVNFIEESYRRPISTEEYGHELRLTYEYICQVFKKYAGITITTYVQLLRLQQAQDLLRRTDKPVQDIAGEVGYEDAYYFARLFKRTTGVTPTDFRRRL